MLYYICTESSNINTKYEVISLSSRTIKQEYDKCLQEAFIHNENKEKLLKRSDREIFILKEKEVNSFLSRKRLNSNSSSRLKATITDADLYNTYVTYMKNKSKHNHSLSEFYFTNKPRRSVMLMNRYSNELVITNTLNQKLKNTKNESQNDIF